MTTPVHGIVQSDTSYSIEQMRLITGNKDERLIINFLNKHGYKPAVVGRGFNQISGYIWNQCIQKEMLTNHKNTTG